jgi:L-alanine-DL-glutamate epimerase-like enolase superfamily enzyme
VKITKVTVTRYRVPFVVPYVTAAGRATHREGFIVQLETDDGLRGVGEASMLPDRTANLDAFQEALRFDVNGAVGTELTAWLDGSIDGGRRAVAALSCAAADAFGRALDVSVAHLAAKGVGRDADKSVAVNALVTGGSINEIVASAAAAVEQGYGTLKLKVGMSETVEAEVARVRAVREAVRPTTYLRLDANGAWDVGRAIDTLRALQPYNVEYVEQPVPAGDLEAMARVRQGAQLSADDALLTEAPALRIAADEDVTDAASARRVFNAAAADVIVVKPLQAGGLKDWLRLLELSPGDAVVTTSIDTGIGTALALHLAAASGATYAHGLSTLPLLEDDLIVQTLPVVQGRMNLPLSSGLGVDLDEAALERYAVSRWQAP